MPETPLAGDLHAVDLEDVRPRTVMRGSGRLKDLWGDWPPHKAFVQVLRKPMRFFTGIRLQLGYKPALAFIALMAIAAAGIGMVWHAVGLLPGGAVLRLTALVAA